jgi:hypothetical protein
VAGPQDHGAAGAPVPLCGWGRRFRADPFSLHTHRQGRTVCALSAYVSWSFAACTPRGLCLPLRPPLLSEAFSLPLALSASRGR